MAASTPFDTEDIAFEMATFKAFKFKKTIYVYKFLATNKFINSTRTTLTIEYKKIGYVRPDRQKKMIL